MREKLLFNNDWEFALTEPDTDISAAEAAGYRAVDIPHDWLIYDTGNLYRSGCGYYRKYIDITENELDGKAFILYFDGVYMDSTVFVNGSEVCRHRYGYSSFQADITAFLAAGRNRIDVRVNYISPNSRWYSGAGIYRNVYLYILPAVHINIDGVYISAAAASGDIYVKTEFTGISSPARLVHTVLSPDGTAVACAEAAVTSDSCECTLHVDSPELWSLEERRLYTLRTELVCGGTSDIYDNVFGFRTIEFNADRGFILNGKSVKLKGVCLHHDLGCLGAAVNYSALERQLVLMKEMGVNSIRTSHNMPAPELIEICDRIGLLVNSESFDMWELPKTEFDYARFFKDNAHLDVESWVRRDRNHPCLIMWSIGNEIFDTHKDSHGYEIAEMLKGYVREFDYKCNAGVTIGSNYIEWENSQRIGEMLGISGYNYTERCYDEHHRKYPNTVIYGSETSSAVRSRGIYHFPADIPQLTHEDCQCSSLANSCVGWGKPSEDAWIMDRDRPFCMGQYVWTGIDYIGEPTPYSTKNSYFGIADTCCLPKDIYYFYQSVWRSAEDKPMVHLLPYWSFNEGQLIDVIAYTNAPSVELFVNGVSAGICSIDHEKGSCLHGQWKVPYEHGEITARAYNAAGEVIAEASRRSFGDPVRVRVTPERTTAAADGRDVVFAVISVEDENGVPVENARNRVWVNVSGAGVLIGMDNGDSTDYEQYKTNNRLLFSGKAVCAVRTLKEWGDITITVSSQGLESDTAVISSQKCEEIQGVSCSEAVFCEAFAEGDIPVREIRSVCDVKELTPDKPSAEIVPVILPENATYKNLTCHTVKAGGIKSSEGKAELADGRVIATGLGDGEFIVRICCSNGGKYPQVISETAFVCTGMGQAVRSPYEFVPANTFSGSLRTMNMVENAMVSGFGGGSYISYENMDFGRAGSGRITIYVGNACNRTVPVEIWDGIPDEGRLLCTAAYPHNNGWDRALPMEFELDAPIRGMHTLSVRINDGVLFGGFEFERRDEAFSELYPASCDEIYGDDYSIDGDSIIGIGNNVVIGFTGLDFGSGASHVLIKGRTENELNTIQLRTVKDGVMQTRLLEFTKMPEYGCQRFDIEPITGVNDVSFVFLPGSSFDFESFTFEK